MPNVTPAHIARFLNKKPEVSQDEKLVSRARLEVPGIVALIESIGLVLDEQIDLWKRYHEPALIHLWLSNDSEPASLVSSWLKIRGDSLPLFTHLIVESRLSRLGAEIGSYLRSSGSSYANAITDARWMVAEGLRRQAASVKFHEPVMLVRVADMTANAFEALAPFVDGATDADDERPSRSLARVRRQVGRQAIMAARFSTGTVEKLENALTHLRELCTTTHDVPTLILRIEASLELYHVTGDKSYLTDAVRFIETRTITRQDWPAWHLIVGEIWLNLADHATTRGRDQFLTKADHAFSALNLQELELTYEIRWVMFKALRKYVGKIPHGAASIRGVRMPYALRSARELPDIIYDASDYLVESLRPAAERGQYQYREFLAELQSRLARTRNAQAAVPLLLDAIRLRRPVGSKHALSGARDILAQAQDLLLLAQHTDTESYRTEGIDLLVREHRRTPTTSEPLVLIANEIEERGSSHLTPTSFAPDLTHAIRQGNYTFIFALAAESALSNPHLRVSGLGGRGETYTVTDFSGITGETFVFKRTSRSALERDEAKAHFISGRIEHEMLNSEFGVIEHIGEITSSPLVDSETSISIRRYVRGRTLYLALSEGHMDRQQLLRSTVRFLGLLHYWEKDELPTRRSSRSQIKLKELGRWLKKLAGPEKLELFNAWWAMVEGVVELPRRDAHSLNWLVDDDYKISAADLEATGHRPVTYELAQLVDDHPVLPPRDWSTRESLLRKYLSAARVTFDAKIFLAYRASTAARAVGILTDSKSSEQRRNHGYSLLAHLSVKDPDPTLRTWCLRVLRAWSIKTGLADPTRLKAIQPNDRVRISKAMAYHLRHDPTAQTAREGWMFVEDLADVMQANGHNVTPQQLIVVAGALGEPRFQLDDQEIRATYGHSVARRTDYEHAVAPDWLYHATPASNLASVFEAQAGLQPMGRQMVHLSIDPMRALRTAQRHSESSYLLKAKGSDLTGVVRAAEDTWLVPSVAASHLSLVTLAEMAEYDSLSNTHWSNL